MNEGMTASDIFVMMREIRDLIIGNWILNVYQLNGTLLFKLSQETPNKLWLLIEPGRRIHSTAVTYEREAKQRAFCRALRKHFRDNKITAFNQHDFDRVVYLKAGPADKQFTLIIELFGGGNAILLDPKNRIVSAMTYKRMRDRDIIRGNEFKFPPLRAQDPRTTSEEEYSAIIDASEHDIIRTIVHGYSISGTTAEEILARASIAPNTLARTLTTKQRRKLYHTLKEFFELLSTGQLSPHIILDPEGEPIEVLALPSPRHKDVPMKQYDSFNEALDAFFVSRFKEEGIDDLEEQYQQELTKIQKLLKKQQQHLEKMRARAIQSRSTANAIYQQLSLIEELLTTINNARQKDVTWKEIERRLILAKEKQISAATLFDCLDPRSGHVHIILDDQRITLDIRLSAAENANQLFQRSKQLEKKVSGAQKAIEDTTRKLTNLQQRREEEITQAQARRVLKRRKKRWFEKFRWFKTSSGLLVLGGRDSVSNQQLVRKYLEEEDIFFHGDIRGAPVVIVKTESKDSTKEDLEEAAIFAVSFSRAWSAGWSVCDVYWVKSQQVSLTAPTGEYLPKGGVMVRGTRNYLKNTPLRLTIGIVFENEFAIVVAGPESAIRQQTDLFVSLVPGNLKVSDVAKRLRKYFAERAPASLKQSIQALTLDEIIAALPPGPCDIEKS
ncbi:MAG: ribosome rescue protein RqcH [Promethearchaeota archaeon]